MRIITNSCSGTPTSARAPSPFLRPSAFEYDAPRHRSRSRGRANPPPRPTVEDELVSLSRESSASRKLSWQSYDPPERGILEQNPIILEADVSKAEAARLQDIPCAKDRDDDVNPENRKRTEKKDDNPERRFVLIPKSDTYDPNEESEVEARRREKAQKPAKNEPRKEERREPRRDSSRQERPRRDERKQAYYPEPPKQEERRPSERPPPVERRRSRQELPVLETKVPREIPPQFRRSASTFSGIPKDSDGTPCTAGTPRTPAESFLSPEVSRPSAFSQSVPRQNVHDALWGKTSTPVTEQRSGGNSSGSRPGTPQGDRRNSGSFENAGRLQAEKLTRPQQLAGELSGRRQERHSSPAKSSRSSIHSGNHYSSSEDDDMDSDSDHHRTRVPKGWDERNRRSPSRSNRSSVDAKHLSRFSSPLPSPKVSPSQLPSGKEFERADTFPPRGDRDRQSNSRPVSPFSPDKENRVDRLTPVDATRPKSRQSSAAPIPTPLRISMPHGAMPILIPSAGPSANTSKRSPSTPQFEENKPLGPRPPPQGQAQQKPFWQPAPFQPPSNNLERPVGSFRRFSEDVERGHIAPLPTCPRTSFTRGRNDWLTLPNCPEFNICPSCFGSTIASTEFRHAFVPAPRRSPDTPVLCDFGNSPWYRIAWLLTLKEKRRDLNLFYGLASIAANVQPCLGKHEAVRQWHSIIDPKTSAPIRGFDVCYSCVKSVETLLPAVRGVFVRTDSLGSSSPRICDLRFDSKRFIQYFDALETTADLSSDMYEPPDTRDLAYLCRKLALIPECQRDRDLADRRWHIITQLPEFTVCEECFDEVVYPEIDDNKAVAKLFSKDLKRMPRASCQLYGEKMRGVFRLAVDSGDYKLLATKARERKIAEESFKRDVAELRRQGLGNPAMDREFKRREEEWSRWE